MKIENKTPTLLEQYKEQLELAKAIANLSPNEKECLFNQDLQDIFDNIKGYEKGTQGHNYTYANLTEVHRAIKEACKNKVFFYHIETVTSLKTIVCHSLTGLKIEVESEKPLIEKMSSLNSRVNFMQAFGSWQTYTKRYHLLALFSVAEEDDGAEKLTENKENKVEKKFLPAKAPVEPVKPVEKTDETPVEPVKKPDAEDQKDIDYIKSLISQGFVTNINQVENVILNNSIVKNKKLAEPKHLEKFKKFLQISVDNYNLLN